MGAKNLITKIIISSLLIFINLTAIAHEDEKHEKHEKHEKTSFATQQDKQLLTNEQLNILRRERQRDELHSLFTKVIGTQNPEDQYKLGNMFRLGDGVEKDDIQAYVWTALSLTNGYPGATKTLRDLEHNMSTYEVNYAIDLLRKIRELR